MRSLVNGSLQFPQLIIVASIVLVFFGASRLNDMPVDVYPEFAPVTVEVRSEALGLSAEEVASLITAPLEADLLSNVPWVELIRSESVAGLSSVELIFEPGTDLLRARQVVQERVSQAAVALPGASKPPEILQPRSSTSRVMMISLSSEDLSLIDLSVLARWSIRPRLLGVDGVSNVAIWGQREKQLQVQVDPDRLESQRVSLAEVIETTANSLWASPLSFVEASVPGTGGWIDTPNQRIGIQHISPIRTPGSLAQVPLETRPELSLADVASVVEGHQPLIGDAVLDSRSGLVIVIEKWPEANTLAVTDAIDEAFEAMAPGLRGVDLDPTLYRAAVYIEEARDNLTILAAVIAVLLLVFLIFDWRLAAMAAVTIPLAVLAAANVLYLLGETMNLMAVAGISAALVFAIDDAVLSSDGLSRRLGSGRQGASLSGLIEEALAAAHSPLTYATLILLLLLLPLFSLSSVAGEFFPPAALAFGSAVVTSAVVSVVLAPPLALLLFSLGGPRVGRTRLALAIEKTYGRLIHLLLPRWFAVTGVAALVVVAGIALATQLEEEFLVPASKDRHLLVQWDGAPGTSLPEMSRIVSQAAAEIGQIPGVVNVGGHVGRAITSDQVVAVNSGEIWVTVGKGEDYGATVARLEDIVSGYPGLAQSLLTYPDKRVGEVLRGTTRDLVVRVYGDEPRELQRQAEVVRSELENIAGVEAPLVESLPGEPTITIQVDLQAAEAFGVKPGDVRRSAATLLSGLLVGNLFEEQKVFEVVVWSTPETRSSVESVQNLLIDTPSGTFVRLSDVAAVSIAENAGTVQRESISRYVDVTADIEGRGVAGVEEELRERVRLLSFPVSYHAEVVTEKATGFLRSTTNPLPFAASATAGAFLLLQAAFRSWRLGLLAFLTLPAALSGAVIALVVDGGDLSVGSYLGLLAVLGLSIRNGVALIGGLQSAESGIRTESRDPANRASSELDAGLVAEVATQRAVPVIASTVAVAVAMLPLLLAGDAAGLEVIRPMAAVILGGAFSSALLSLFILPSLYLRFWERVEAEVLE